MPREQINYPDLGEKFRQQVLRAEQARSEEGPVLPESKWEPWNESAVHVSWVPKGEGPYQGHGWVQLGFEADLEYMKFAADEPNGSTEDRTFMWTKPLSIGDIDRMIAVLKKARRKAYPQDN